MMPGTLEGEHSLPSIPPAARRATSRTSSMRRILNELFTDGPHADERNCEILVEPLMDGLQAHELLQKALRPVSTADALRDEMWRS